MTGGELFEYLASREKVNEATATMFLRQVLDGVCHLHEKNIVHLDLKVSASTSRSVYQPQGQWSTSRSVIYLKVDALTSRSVHRPQG